jgi:gas vesicle protein
MRRFGFFLFGTLIGGLIGAVLALLFAPASGTELRGQIKDYAGKTVSDVREAALQKRAELEQQIAKLRTGKSQVD